ncbi:MAG: hypothetical protein H0U74_12245, partial [Bradymonadaceae bacterium]|nr:hypothetical protein [Lujinxingiaceae bacterium]
MKWLCVLVCVASMLLLAAACSDDARRGLGSGKSIVDAGVEPDDDVQNQMPTDRQPNGSSCLADGECQSGNCDPLSKKCVECLFHSECGPQEQCTSNRCVLPTACANSLDCAGALVCDRVAGLCVACVDDADCLQSGDRCLANQCRPLIDCTSDRDCTAQGMLCHRDSGECRSCLANVDCPSPYLCSAVGACEVGVCAPGKGQCQGNSRVVCNAGGTGYEPAQPCAQGTLCVVEANEPVCRTQNCTPNAEFCDGRAIRKCDAAGQQSTLVATCSAGERCAGGATPYCVCENGCGANGSTVCGGSTPYCIDGCCAACIGSADCTVGELCVDGTCMP